MTRLKPRESKPRVTATCIQLRTLQRHLAVWRANTVLTFDDGVTDDVEHVALESLPGPLRVDDGQASLTECSA